jgi:phage replication initiation protein
LHEDYAFYSYMEQYVCGDIVVMVSPDEDKGCLLELKGKGCRQLFSY